MSNKLLTAVWDYAPYYGGAMMIYVALADQSSDEGVCWPHVDTLAHKARMNVRNTQKYLAQLEADGAIKRERRGRYAANRYIVYAPLPDGGFGVLARAPRRIEVSQETPLTPRGVAGDTPEVSQETPQRCRRRHPRGVAGDTPEVSQETPQGTPIEPSINPQVNLGPSPLLENEMEQSPRPPNFTELQFWCHKTPKGQRAMAPYLAKWGRERISDQIECWNMAHPNRLWQMQQDRGELTTGPGIEPVRAS